MNKKILITSALLTLSLFGCRHTTPPKLSSSTSSEASSFPTSEVSEGSSVKSDDLESVVTSEETTSETTSQETSSSPTSDATSDTSTGTSSESSSIIEKVVFDTPTNVAINGSSLTWDNVDDALSYNIKIVLSDNSEHQETSTTNSFDLSTVDYFIKGVHSISVRVNGDDYHYISAYSNPIEYIYGIDQTKVNEFVSNVNLIESITLDSRDVLEQLMDIYNTLDEIDVLDEKCIEAKNKLAKYQGEYLLLYTQTLNVFKGSDVTSDDINVASSFYKQCLNKEDENVLASLNIPVGYSCFHDELIFASDPTKTNVYISYVGTNILYDLIQLDNISLTVDGQEVELIKDGFYYCAQIESGAKLFINNEEYADIQIPNVIDNSITNIEVKENPVSKTKIYTYEKNVDENVNVLIFDSDSISLDGAFPIIKDNAKGMFTTPNDYFTNKDIYYQIKDLKTPIESYSLLLYTTTSDGNVSYTLINENCMNQKVEPLDLKLDSPSQVDEITSENLKFNDDGSIAYRWELINNNIEVNVGISSGIEFVFFNENSEITEENIVASYVRNNAGFIDASNINDALIKAKVPSNSTLKAGIRFISDNPDYSSSDIVMVEGSHTYELDYSLPNYYSLNPNTFFIRESGELAYYFEAFMDNINPVSKEIDHLEVWVIDGNTDNATLSDENTDKVKGKFNIYYSSVSHTDTSKEAIENILFELGLNSGSYRFTSRFITKDGSVYTNSDLSNVTGAFDYVVSDLSSVNLVNLSRTIVLTNELENNNLLEMMDNNQNSRYIASNTETGTLEDVYVIIDLKKVYNLDRINIHWEGAYAKKYSIYGIEDFDKDNFDITDLSSWSLINQVENRSEYLVNEEISVTTETMSRYILLHLEERGTPWNYSIYEFEVYAK